MSTEGRARSVNERAQSEAFGGVQQEAVLRSSQPQRGGNFGPAAISGHMALVGAPFEYNSFQNAGAAYVFVRAGLPPVWQQTARLTVPDLDRISYFGNAVALSGNTAVVGAPLADGLSNGRIIDTGAAYVFERQGGGTSWAQAAKLIASDPDDDYFGFSVAVSGSTAVVGAPFEDGGPGDPLVRMGAAYVFQRDEGGPNGWGQVRKLAASDALFGNEFGARVAISGDTIVVGARYGDVDAVLVNTGAAYVFERHAGGPDNWGQVAKLTASDPRINDFFGEAVAIAANTIVVGAHDEDGGPGDPAMDAGAAYVFDRHAGGPHNWGQVAKLAASDPRAQDRFGVSVGVSGDAAIVGAQFGGDPLAPHGGAAYVFGRNQGGPSQWGEVAKLTGASSKTGGFGTFLSMSGPIAVVGAHGSSYDVAGDGAAHVFRDTAAPPWLTVVPEGSGHGTVTSSPAGITCGVDCDEGYPPATQVTLSATPAAGSVFRGWGGDLDCTDGLVSTTVDLLCTAFFDLDGDADGLPDTWERQFGLDAGSAAGANGANGDPDGDGRTNAQELADGTHPLGTFQRYLAEGATSPFFATRLALLNPDTTTAHVQLRYLKSDGSVTTQAIILPGHRRHTIDVATLGGLAAAEFSTILEADSQVVIDRTMRWDGTAYGSHAETGIPAPAPTWYLAEGSTAGPFSLFYLVQNPDPTQASNVRVTFLRPDGTTTVKSYVVAPRSRFTLWVNLIADVTGTDVSAIVETTNAVPIIVERAMYLSTAAQPFAAGHESAGVTAPATNWFLAEGATGPYFDEFVLIANPNPAAARVRATYLLPGGTTFIKDYLVSPTSRFNIWVDEESFPGVGKALADTAVSMTLASQNGVSFIAERAMWWPGATSATWAEAHNSPGATVTGPRWALAEGEVGGLHAADTYILIANTSSTPGTVRVTLLFEDGTSAVKMFAVAARSRFNVWVQAEFQAAGRRFGALVESIGETPADLVVERAMYSNASGVVWAAGSNALATLLP